MTDAEPIILSTGGPHSSEYTRQVAEAAAEAIRVLNHATLNHAAQALRYPADADAVVESLATAAMRLPQLLEQLGYRLAEWGVAGRLKVTYGPWQGDCAGAVADIQQELYDAGHAINAAYEALNRARQVTATISAARGWRG